MTVFEKNDAIDYALKIERVAAYVRVSSTEQKLHGLSLDAQKMKLTEYAKAHGMKIVEWYVDEGVSGRKLIRNRPELQRMIHDAAKGKFDRIIFIKLDRFFRSVAEYHECMKQIAPVTWTTTEEKYDLSNAQGRMLVNMKLTIAEMEADTTGERIHIVNDYKVTTGQPLSGSMPFGFKIEKDILTGRKKIIKHPETAPILDDLIEHVFMYQSVRKALIYLHAKHNISMSYNSLYNLLTNPMLCGEYRDNPKYCEAYLTKERFEKLQDIIKRRNIKANTENRTYIFSGLILCPECGNKMSGGIHHCLHASGRKYQYKRYRCQNHRVNVRCKFSKAVTESVIERQMLERVEIFLNEAKIKSAQIDDTVDKQLLHDVEAIHDEIDRLNYSWQTGKIRKVETYEKRYNELTEKLEEAEAKQGEIVVKDFSKIEAILHGGWKEIYNNLEDTYKRAFWRSFVKSIELVWTTERKEIVKVNFF